MATQAPVRADSAIASSATAAPHRVVHRRTGGLAAQRRTQEPGCLDHLEVVVAHRDAGTGLERPELAVPGPDQHGRGRHVLVVGRTVVDRDLQLAHPPEVPRQRPTAAVQREASTSSARPPRPGSPPASPAHRTGSAAARTRSPRSRPRQARRRPWRSGRRRPPGAVGEARTPPCRPPPARCHPAGSAPGRHRARRGHPARPLPRWPVRTARSARPRGAPRSR